MSQTQTTRNAINKALTTINHTYHPSIPLTAIFEIVKNHAGQVVDVDGTPWSGFLCGDDSNCTFDIEGSKIHLYLAWYRMPSGNYEITAYAS